MNELDRRKEFKDVPWKQGRLLLTDNTLRWNKEQRNEGDYIERCIAFVNFTDSDQGRCREYVFQFGSPAECNAAVECHNELLMKEKTLMGVRSENAKRERKDTDRMEDAEKSVAGRTFYNEI